MRHWLWRLMGVFSLGGGFSGLVFVFIAITQGLTYDLWTNLTLVVGVALYGYGVWSGLRLLEDRPGARQVNLIYWYLQIPIVNTPVFAIQFFSGASVSLSASLSWDQTGTDQLNFGANAVFGSLLDWAAIQGDVPWKFGVNVFAVAIILFGRRLLRQEEAAKSEIW